MLRLRHDRQDYEQLLSPPLGYETEFAVGTTYSMDMQALLGVCLALGLSASVDHNENDAPMLSFESIRRMMGKLIIFYDTSHLMAPKKENQLFILMEKIVFDVAIPHQAFHPKLWVVKYSNQSGESLYRCVVMSRNLTFDRSWDVVACLEGTTKDGLHNNGPLVDFLGVLGDFGKKKFAPEAKLSALLNLGKEIGKVEFNLEDSPFSSYQFCPFGIPNHGKFESKLFDPCQQMLVISPFLSSNVVDELGKATLSGSKKSILITRKDELLKINKKLVRRFDFYSVSDDVCDAEFGISEGDESDAKTQEIHAKLYFKDNGSNESDLYLGSLNASFSALNGNIELLLRLMINNDSMTIKSLKRDLFEEKDIFQQVTNLGETENIENDTQSLETCIQDICHSSPSASLSFVGDYYTAEVDFKQSFTCEDIVMIKISPFQRCDLVQDYSKSLVFRGLTLADLSEFYILEVCHRQKGSTPLRRIIKIRTDNMPLERDKAIVNNIIKDKDHFYLLIGYILGDHVSEYDSIISPKSKSINREWQVMLGSGIYEKLLYIASHEPQKLDEISQLIDLVKGENKIPDGFQDLFNTIYMAVHNERK